MEKKIFAEKYLLKREIGRGGMGTVFKVVNVHDQQDYALKILLDVEDKYALKSFFKESKASKILNHKNIIRIHDLQPFVKTYFLVMEYVDGFNLRDMIKILGGLPARFAADLMIKISHAVDYAHKRGIIHRDLKPGNIMLDKNKEPKIIDFGVAKIRDTITASKTGVVIGTCNYISLEQLKGRKINNTTDIYSLGVILYEMITGEMPFKGNSVDEVATSIESGLTYPENFPIPLIEIIDKCIERSPRARYQEARFLAKDLKRIRSELPHHQIAFPNKNKMVILVACLFSAFCIALLAIIFHLFSTNKSIETKYLKSKKNLAYTEKNLNIAIRKLKQNEKKSLVFQGKAKELKKKLQTQTRNANKKITLAKHEIRKNFIRELSKLSEKYRLEKEKSRIIYNKLKSLEYKDVKVPPLEFLHIDTRTYSCGGISHRIKEFRHVRTGILFALVPGGIFAMGSNNGALDERPVHFVEIKAFLISKTEISQKVWLKFLKEKNNKYKKNPSRIIGDNLPIEGISWNRANNFCKNLGKGFSLPSEAQWEYACRSGTNSRYYWGDNIKAEDGTDIRKRYCWFRWNSGGKFKKAHSVGVKIPNAFGLYDMLGNVWEWCSDGYLPYPKNPNMIKTSNVSRGGSCSSEDVRVTDRNKADAGESLFTGFRLVFNLSNK